MTALVFALQPEQVCIAMDTLVVGANDRLPLSFQRKFLPVPESDLVIAGTGHAGLIYGWFQHVRGNLSGVSIDDLNQVTPEILRTSVNAKGGLDGLTATIYHFGYSPRQMQYVGFAYRSKHTFRSESLEYSLGFKPVVKIPQCEEICFPDFLIQIILEQQKQDDLQPLTDRVGIGGDIEFVVMSGRKIQVERVHRFASYEAEAVHIGQRALS